MPAISARITTVGRSLLLATVTVELCLTVVLSAPEQEKLSFPLPSDPLAPVITLDWRGGFVLPPRKNMNPALTVRANGTVTVIDSQGGNLETMLSASQLQDLLRFVISDQNFFAISVTKILKAIAAEERRTRRGMTVIDDPDTVVRIKTADRESEVRFNALGLYSRAHPAIKPLQQLSAVQTRLRGLIEELTAGGKQAIAVALDQANAYLKQQYPQPAVLGADDYERTVQSADGRKLVEFVRDQGDGTSMVVAVEYQPGEQPRINVQTRNNPPETLNKR